MQHEAINQRELLKGTLGTIILQLLSDNKKLYGYEITQLVKVKSNSAVLIKEGRDWKIQLLHSTPLKPKSK